jgi:hypothetical protein
MRLLITDSGNAQFSPLPLVKETRFRDGNIKFFSGSVFNTLYYKSFFFQRTARGYDNF